MFVQYVLLDTYRRFCATRVHSVCVDIVANQSARSNFPLPTTRYLPTTSTCYYYLPYSFSNRLWWIFCVLVCSPVPSVVESNLDGFFLSLFSAQSALITSILRTWSNLRFWSSETKHHKNRYASQTCNVLHNPLLCLSFNSNKGKFCSIVSTYIRLHADTGIACASTADASNSLPSLNE